jgi:hypothetical protein
MDWAMPLTDSPWVSTLLANSSLVVRVTSFALCVDGQLGRDGWRLTMSLRPNGLTQIPAETSRVARAAFPNRCLAMRARDALGPLFADKRKLRES